MELKRDSMPMTQSSSPLPIATPGSPRPPCTDSPPSTNAKTSLDAYHHPRPSIKFTEQNITHLRGFIDWIKFTRSHFDELSGELVNLTPMSSNWYSFRHGSTGRKYHIRIVIGNEGCDLDSFASSLTFSYLFYLKSIVPIINRFNKKELKRSNVDRDPQPHSSRKINLISKKFAYGCDFIVLPVVFTTRPLLEIRGDCTRACEMFGIDMDNLIFIDDLLNFFKAAGDSHNQNAPILTDLAQEISHKNSQSNSLRSSPGPDKQLAMGLTNNRTPSPIYNQQENPQTFQFFSAYIQLDIILVDQPSIPYLLLQYLLQQTHFLNFQIISILDHHASNPSMKPFLAKSKSKAAADLSSDPHKAYFYSNVAVCASNMTLMTEEFRSVLSGNSRKLDPYIRNDPNYLGPVFGLLLGTILVDSGNLDISTGKVTNKDLDATRWLVVQISPYRKYIINLEGSSNIAPSILAQEAPENDMQDKTKVVGPNHERKLSKRLKSARSTLAEGFKKGTLSQPEPIELQTSLFTAINTSKVAYNTKLDLPASLALEKDFKIYELCSGKGSMATVVYGISSIGIPMSDWIERAKKESINPLFKSEQIPPNHDESNSNLLNILHTHCRKYDLSFLLIISAYLGEEDNLAKVEGSKDPRKNYKRQLSVFIPVHSRWVLRSSATNETTKDIQNDPTDDANRQSPQNINNNHSNIQTFLPKHTLFTQFFGQNFIDTVKLVADKDLPHIFFPIHPDLSHADPEGHSLKEENPSMQSNFTSKKELMDKASNPVDCVFSVFQQLDTTYSRKKVQPLLHQYFETLLH